jgi:DNA polymerase-3 subunit epsilon
MPTGARRALPDRPGVYRFLRSNRDVLYVGKATSLKKRVAGHFSQASRAADRNQEMLTQALAIEHTICPTPLEAALLECDEIKRLDPPYNVQLREATRVALFVARDLFDLSEAPDVAHPWGPLPSRFGPSALGAVRKLAEGEPPDERLRARAVGVPPPFAPDEAMFGEAWGVFASRHLSLPARTPWGRVVRATTRLALLSNEDGLEPRDDEAPPGWDVSRIVRYLERSVLVGGQLLRRARWLTSLSDSVLAYREAGAWRVVVIERGVVVSIEDASSPQVLPDPPARRPWRERQASFDGASYDRLRVLTTELRRVLDEDGDARLALPGGRVLGRDVLARWLRFV